jgi:uroporphyrinogen III methyltransferase/synthase
MIELVSPEDPQPLLDAVERLAEYAWVLFTSVNAVERFFQVLRKQGGDARSLAGVKIAAVGSATAEALEVHGLRADLVPSRYQAEGILEDLEGRFQEGDRFLLPRAESAREVLPETLRKKGAVVDVVPVYRTVCAAVSPEIVESFEKGEVDVVTFTSSSTVENFHQAIGSKVPRNYQVASIGPVTSARAEELGYPVDWSAPEATVASLLDAVVEGLGD